LNLSILDGWWIEAHEIDEQNGWAIGKGATYSTQELQDEEDVVQLYRLLEGEVVPLFFDRDTKGVPKRWLERVRTNLATIPANFNTDRMVREYTDRAYIPLGAAWFSMQKDRFEPARKRSERAQAIRKGFESLKIREAQIADVSALARGRIARRARHRRARNPHSGRHRGRARARPHARDHRSRGTERARARSDPGTEERRAHVRGSTQDHAFGIVQLRDPDQGAGDGGLGSVDEGPRALGLTVPESKPPRPASGAGIDSGP
jgi:hypothetical protein